MYELFIGHPVSNWYTSFSFHVNRTNLSWDMSNGMFDLEETRPKFKKKLAPVKFSNRISPKSNQAISMTRRI